MSTYKDLDISLTEINNIMNNLTEDDYLELSQEWLELANTFNPEVSDVMFDKRTATVQEITDEAMRISKII